MQYPFWIIFIFLLVAIIFFDEKYAMLRDISLASSHPSYSWSRVQLAWWSVIILSCFITVLVIRGEAPTLDISTVILLGISAATITAARAIDISDIEKTNSIRHQNDTGKNFLLDILSDESGVSIHRFQTLVLNMSFGIWFIYAFLHNLIHGAATNNLIPIISQNNLILLGLSSATYAALKTTENKTATVQAENKANLVAIKAPEQPNPPGTTMKAVNYIPGRKRSGNI